jgi:hypothetical protein
MSAPIVILSGPTCVNKRSIDSACDLLDSNIRRRLADEELYGLLTFISNLALSKSIAFDGTLPAEQLQQTQEKVEALCIRSGASSLPVETVSHSDPNDVYPDFCRISSRLRQHILKFDLLPCDEPHARAHEKFVSRLIEVNDRFQSGSHHDDIGKELANEISDPRSRFDGSKCIAAIACGGPELVSSAIRIYSRYERSEGARITGALINRFRQFYLATLAADGGASFQPDRKLSVLADRTFGTFIEYVAQALLRKAAAANPDDLWRVFAPEIAPPAVGLLILARVSARNGSPEDIVIEALRFKERYGHLIDESDRITAAARLGGLVAEEFGAEFQSLEREIGSPGTVARIKTRRFFDIAEHALDHPLEPLALIAATVALEHAQVVIPMWKEAHTLIHQMVNEGAITPSATAVQYYNFRAELDAGRTFAEFMRGPINGIFLRG